MGRLVRAYDWSRSPVGNPEGWSQGLRVAVRLMFSTSVPMIIWWGKEYLHLYNDGFRATLAEDRHPHLLGMLGSARTDPVWRAIRPTISSVMAGNGPCSDSDRPFPPRSSVESRCWDFDYCPVDDDTGVGGVLAIVKNISKDTNDERLTRTSAQLVSLFESCPGYIVVFIGPDHKFEFVNQEFRSLMGDRNYTDRTVRDVLPELDGQGFFELLDHVYQTGDTYVGKDMPLRYKPMGEPLEATVDFVYKALLAPGGTIYGVFVQGTYAIAGADPERDTPHLLTIREREVLGWLALGKTAGETAIILNLSKRTCETHIYSAARKLDAANGIQTVVEAIRRGELRL
jgi:DNA-binding CsgD family transcriptional regulator